MVSFFVSFQPKFLEVRDFMYQQYLEFAGYSNRFWLTKVKIKLR